MENAQTILILGGGVGGLITANLLRKKLSKQHKIILVDKEKDHIFSPSLLWLMTDNRKSNKITRPLTNLKKKNIEIIHGI